MPRQLPDMALATVIGGVTLDWGRWPVGVTVTTTLALVCSNGVHPIGGSLINTGFIDTYYRLAIKL